MAKQPHYPAPVLVTDTETLAACCARLSAFPFVTVDTEFMRERTYYPELCVVQLAGGPGDPHGVVSEVAVVDALAPGLDLAPLGGLLADPAVLKVFHAARQDNEIFLHRFGAVPTPLFDTQVAAMVAGFGDQVGYDALVGAVLGGRIDKAHRFSDWSARPLSPAQIEYAAADVTFLADVHVALSARLRKEGRLAWVEQEMDVLTRAETYRPDPATLWEKLRPRTNNRRMLGALRAIVAWREGRAQQMDIPRQRLVKDESLLEIAATLPEDVAALARVRGVGRGFAEGRSGQDLLAALAEAVRLPEDALPPAPRKDAPRPSQALVALLKVLLAAKSETHGVAARLVAGADEIDRLATEDAPPIPALQGWRREVFGDDALALKAGRLLLGAKGRSVALHPAGPAAPAD